MILQNVRFLLVSIVVCFLCTSFSGRVFVTDPADYDVFYPFINQNEEVTIVVKINKPDNESARFVRKLPNLNVNGSIILNAGRANKGSNYTTTTRTYNFNIFKLDHVTLDLGIRNIPVFKVDGHKVVVGLPVIDTRLFLEKLDDKKDNKASGHQVRVSIPSAPHPNPYRTSVVVLPTSGIGKSRDDIRGQLPQTTIMVFEIYNMKNQLLRKFTFSLTADQELTCICEGPSGPASITADVDEKSNFKVLNIRLVKGKEIE